MAWSLVREHRLCLGPDLADALGAECRELLERWAIDATRIDLEVLWRRHVEAGVGVCDLSAPGPMDVFVGDPEPPQILFHRGDVSAVDGPRVGIVGTRRCTPYGRDVAFELARELAEAGVRVVSGLALGIDAAAHAGVLDAGPDAAPPIAVVGSGLDIVYPSRNAELWRAVERSGLLLSEYPLGRRPQTWQFPARNRLIAALADVLVVVESGERGGSMYTVAEALVRDRPVMAVPGSVRSPASFGTNALLADGAQVLRSAEDVLVQLGLTVEAVHRRGESRPPPDGLARALLDELGWEPTSLEQLVLRLGWSLGEVSAAIGGLESDGWVERAGSWVQRLGR